MAESAGEVMAKSKPWTAEEVRQVRELGGKKNAREIGEQIGRTREAVLRMLHRLGVAGFGRGNQRLRWAEWELANLRLKAQMGKSAREICGLLGKTRWQVSEQRRRLGLFRKTPRLWTPAEVEQLRAAVGVYTACEMTVRLGRSRGCINSKLEALGLKLNRTAQTGRYRIWSAEQEATLRELVATLPAEEIAERVGRTVLACKAKAKAMGIAGVSRCYKRRKVVKRPRLKVPRLPRQQRKHVYVGHVIYCSTCQSPVVNTVEGRQGHRERIGCKRVLEGE
jgi:hypothetical protein